MADIPRSRRVRAAALALGLVASLAGLALVAGPAGAHAGLADSNPAQGERLAAAPATVELTFNEAVSRPAYLALTGPDGAAAELAEPEVVDGTVSAATGDLPLAGTYALSYRVVSADGHPIEGTVTFEVTAGAEPGSRAAAGPSESYLHRHREHVLWGGLAAAVAVALIAWPLVRRGASR